MSVPREGFFRGQAGPWRAERATRDTDSSVSLSLSRRGDAARRDAWLVLRGFALLSVSSKHTSAAPTLSSWPEMCLSLRDTLKKKGKKTAHIP